MVKNWVLKWGFSWVQSIIMWLRRHGYLRKGNKWEHLCCLMFISSLTRRELTWWRIVQRSRGQQLGHGAWQGLELGTRLVLDEMSTLTCTPEVLCYSYFKLWTLYWACQFNWVLFRTDTELPHIQSASNLENSAFYQPEDFTQFRLFSAFKR